MGTRVTLCPMVNPRLTPEQLDLARRLLDDVRMKLKHLSGGDEELLFAYRLQQGLQGVDLRRARQAKASRTPEASQDGRAEGAMSTLQRTPA